METSRASHPRFLWETFYNQFLEDVSLIFKTEVNLEVEQFIFADQLATVGSSMVISHFPFVGKLLERSLAQVKGIPLSEFPKRTYVSGEKYPRNLSKLWEILFTSVNGYLYPRQDERDRGSGGLSASAFAILRQFYLAFSKITDVEPVVDMRDEVDHFVARICAASPISLSGKALIDMRAICKFIFNSPESDELCAPLAQWIEDPFGLHGPGAVFDGEEGASKWDFQAVSGQHQEIFEYLPADYIRGLAAAGEPSLERLDLTLDRDKVKRLSALAVVPKDFRGHRLICIEPKELQFAQQGLMRVLYQHLQTHSLTRQSITFTDQMPSRRLARNLNYATIDLKDASDRVSLLLGRLVMTEPLFELLTRYRSTHILLPDGITINCAAMATMGSALCFPIETVMFFIIALVAILEENGLSGEKLNRVLRSGEVSRFSRLIRVFGDDIIVPVDYAVAVRKLLEASGLAVNHEKTCINGLYRESCGAYYYDRYDVSCTRFKVSRLTSIRDWLSLADEARELNRNGYTCSAQAVCEFISSMHDVPYSYNGFPIRRVARVRTCSAHASSTRSPKSLYRWNDEFQRLEFLMPVWLPKSIRRSRFPRSTDGLYAYFTGKAATNPVDPGTTRMVKKIWTPIFSR